MLQLLALVAPLSPLPLLSDSQDVKPDTIEVSSKSIEFD